MKNIPESLHRKLLNRARETNRPFNELLQHFAVERFLYRASLAGYSNRLMLKGAFSFRVLPGSTYTRPTKDVDFQADHGNSPEEIREVVQKIISIEFAEDGISFDPESVVVTRIVEDADYSGVRAEFKGNLGNARIYMQADFSFGDRIIPESKIVEFPVILDDLPKPQIRCFPPETIIAQKFEAMIKLGELNSRIRDFYDIWFLIHVCEFDAQVLSDAIRETFEHRKTTLTADSLKFLERFVANQENVKMYTAFLKRNRISDAPESLAVLVDNLRLFLEPILPAVLRQVVFEKRWTPSKYWN